MNIAPIQNQQRWICFFKSFFSGVLLILLLFMLCLNNSMAQKIQGQNAATDVAANSVQAPTKPQKPSVVQPSQTSRLFLTDAEKTFIANHQTIIAGATKDWPPFDFVDVNNNYGGYIHDYLQLIGRKTGLKFEYRIGEWSDNLDKIKNGDIDVIGGIKHLEERAAFLDFTPAFTSLTNYFFIRDDIEAVTMSDLNGKTVAIPEGFANIDVFKQRFPTIKVITTATLNDAIDKVIEKRADLLFDYYAVLQHSLLNQGVESIKPFKSARHIGSEKLHLATRKNVPHLQTILQKGMNAITIEEQQAIEKKWLGRVVSDQSLKLTQNEVMWLRAHPSLNLMTNSSWMPYEGIDNNRYVGVVADMVTQLEDTLAVTFNKRAKPIQEKNALVPIFNKADVFIASIDGRKIEGFVKTEPFLTSTLMLVGDEDHYYIEDLAHETDKVIAVANTMLDISALAAKYPNNIFKEVASNKEGLLGVTTGKYDLFLGSLTGISYLLNDLGLKQLHIVGKTNDSLNIGFAVADDLAPFVPILNKAITNIDPKTKAAILNSWGEQSFVTKVDYSLLFKVVGGFLGLFLLVWVWNRRLAKEAGKRTKIASELEIANNRFKLATRAAGLGVWEVEFSPTNHDDINTIDNIITDAANLHDMFTSMEQYGSFTVSFDDYMYALYGRDLQTSLTWQDWIARMNAEDRHNFSEALVTLFKKGGNKDVQFKILPANNEPTVYIQAGMIFESVQDVKRVVGINWDITKIKETEMALEAAKLVAESANQAKTSFIANMSHEIRTPMNAILGFTEILDEQIDDKKLKGFIKTIRASGTGLLGLINGILDLSKIEAGRFELNPVPTNVANLCSNICDMFAMRVREKQIELILDIDPFIPEYVVVDDIRVHQVVFNLVCNAIKFTNIGHVKLSVSATNKTDEQVDILFEVADTGIGIADDQQERIFRPFIQADGQDSRRYEGSGLGLSICQRISELMGATLTLDSEKGVGTSLRFNIPNVTVASEGIHPSFSNSNSEANAVITFDTANILVIDNVVENQVLITEFFAGTKINVLTTDSLNEAVFMLKTTQVNLVMLNIDVANHSEKHSDTSHATTILSELQQVLKDTPVIGLNTSIQNENPAFSDNNEVSQHSQKKDSKMTGIYYKVLTLPMTKAQVIKTCANYLPHEAQQKASDDNNEASYDDVKFADKLYPQEQASAKLILPSYEKQIALCAELAMTNSISQMTDFVKTLSLFNDTHPLYAMGEFIKTLDDSLATFDISTIKSALAYYPVLIECLNEQVD